MIIVKNRECLFSNREQYIGTSHDNNSSTRLFSIPRISVDGIDIANLTFRLNIQRVDGSTDSAYLEKEIREKEVLLTWTIARSIVQIPGTLFINIRAHDDNGTVKWASYVAAVYVEGTIDQPPKPEGGLTELEELERAFDKKTEEILASENARKQAELEREEAEAGRKAAEAEREKQTAEVIETFQEAIDSAEYNAALAKSYSEGNTGIRSGENTDNAEYYSRMAAISSGEAKAAEEAALQAMDDVIQRLNNGEFTGPQGPQGEKGEQGPSGVSIPASSLLYIYTDDADNSAIHCVYDDAFNAMPPLSYDDATGAIKWTFDNGR